jgi:hypothetical protein
LLLNYTLSLLGIIALKIEIVENEWNIKVAHYRGNESGLERKSRPMVPEQIMPRAHMRHHARQMANSCLQIASISAPCRDLRLQFPLSTSGEKE